MAESKDYIPAAVKLDILSEALREAEHPEPFAGIDCPRAEKLAIMKQHIAIQNQIAYNAGQFLRDAGFRSDGSPQKKKLSTAEAQAALAAARSEKQGLKQFEQAARTAIQGKGFEQSVQSAFAQKLQAAMKNRQK